MKEYIQDLLKTCIKEIDSAHEVPQDLLSKCEELLNSRKASAE